MAVSVLAFMQIQKILINKILLTNSLSYLANKKGKKDDVSAFLTFEI